MRGRGRRGFSCLTIRIVLWIVRVRTSTGRRLAAVAAAP